MLGLGFSVVAPFISRRFEHISGTPGLGVLFAVGVMVTGATLVFDQATIGLMRGGLQLSRNVAFETKLLALPATLIILHAQFGVGITVSWVAGTAVSLVPVAVWLRLKGTQIIPRPDWGVLRGLGKAAIAHSLLNIAITVPWALIPRRSRWSCHHPRTRHSTPRGCYSTSFTSFQGHSPLFSLR